ncbi:hypothetical protein DTO013F2_3939 [Penicillium roqueforti]|nr:hypothetical protein DTO013F2_3939 [Penicillium roqueforti]KAI3187721.1 hypothetical protein DTO032C6_3724 [Penicillium roqueforti]
MPDPHPQFSPACPCPIPYILQPEERVEQLKACLQTDFGEAQRVNAEALIRLYESGELGPRQRSDPPVYLIDGQRVDKDSWEDAAKTGIRWCETLEYQQLSRPAIPNILQPEERVEQLKACLQTDFGKAQRVNAEALIRLYESGELGPRQRSDPPVYLIDGQRVDKDSGELGPRQRSDPPVYLIDGQRVDKDSWEDAAKIGIRWCETLDYQQMMSQHEFQANII